VPQPNLLIVVLQALGIISSCSHKEIASSSDLKAFVYSPDFGNRTTSFSLSTISPLRRSTVFESISKHLPSSRMLSLALSLIAVAIDFEPMQPWSRLPVRLSSQFACATES
jgi:hypothetical protein